MPKYTVFYQVTIDGELVIEADSAQEAERIITEDTTGAELAAGADVTSAVTQNVESQVG